MIRLKEKLPKKPLNKKKNIRKKVKSDAESKLHPEEDVERKNEKEEIERIESNLNRLVEISAKLFEYGVEGEHILKKPQF